MMSVITYSLKKDGDKHLTKDFRVIEFRCKDGSDKILLSPETVNILQSIRDYFGRAVYINSAYHTIRRLAAQRTPSTSRVLPAIFV